MDLFSNVNKNSQDDCYTGDALLIKQKTWFELKRVNNGPIFVEMLKSNEGDIVHLPICFRGNMEMKVGIKRDAYSFAWVYEKHLESKNWKTEDCEVDLSRFEHGELEITFLGLEDSVICRNVYEAVKKDKNIFFIPLFLRPTSSAAKNRFITNFPARKCITALRTALFIFSKIRPLIC